MKGVILAGGKGTRLMPLTKVTNKHLLPVGKEPMIYNPIKQLLSSGIDNIMIVTSTDHMGEIVNLLGSGAEFGAKFTYGVQEEAKGIAHALSLSKDFAHGQRIVVILGDNIATHSIRPYVENFKAQERGARVLLKQVNDPNRFGIAAIDEKKIIEIEEKPDMPKSDYAVVGYYMYDEQVFDYIERQSLAKTGEYEITSVNSEYVNSSQMEFDVLTGDWTDAGTHESYQYANRLLLQYENELQGV